MPIHNPRRFSAAHGVGIGAVTTMAAFASLCFDFGNGDFSAGIASALNYLVIVVFSLWIFAALVAGLATLAGRWIGTTLTTAIALCLLGGAVIHSYFQSQPMPRFRQVIWADAPDSLQVRNYESFPSFNDGTVYLFSVSATPDMIEQLCDSAGLIKIRPSPDEVRLSFLPVGPRRLREISKRSFPTDTEFYTLKNIELAYTPSTQEALVVSFPRRD